MRGKERMWDADGEGNRKAERGRERGGRMTALARNQ